ncbi:hypothetical protein Tco_0594650, partial [Tanacetum coccineum]
GISCAKQRQVRASKEGKWQGISKKKKEPFEELSKLSNSLLPYAEGNQVQ